MAQLKSAAMIDLNSGDNDIYTIPSGVTQVKLSEIILANKDTNATANLSVKIYKKTIDQFVTIIPSPSLLALESKFISMSTFLTEGDIIIVTSNLINKVDVMVSCVEM